MRFGGMPNEVGQCSYRVAKQLQPGLPPKLIHTVLSTLVLQGGLKSPPMSSSSATSPAELSLRPTLWRTRGNGRRTRPTTTSCARRTLKQPAWLALGRLLPVWPTIAVVPLVKMHRAGQPPSVVSLDRKRTALANPFGCALDRKRTASGQPLRLS
jgi:hypothetical protein